MGAHPSPRAQRARIKRASCSGRNDRFVRLREGVAGHQDASRLRVRLRVRTNRLSGCHPDTRVGRRTVAGARPVALSSSVAARNGTGAIPVPCRRRLLRQPRRPVVRDATGARRRAPETLVSECLTRESNPADARLEGVPALPVREARTVRYCRCAHSLERIGTLGQQEATDVPTDAPPVEAPSEAPGEETAPDAPATDASPEEAPDAPSESTSESEPSE